MASAAQINNTSYYRLPCGFFLEDFIYAKGLNFNMGSALKYLWRAGYKDGESEDKDKAKAKHYIDFEAKCRGIDSKMVENEVLALREEAYNWKLHDK